MPYRSSLALLTASLALVACAAGSSDDAPPTGSVASSSSTDASSSSSSSSSSGGGSTTTASTGTTGGGGAGGTGGTGQGGMGGSGGAAQGGGGTGGAGGSGGSGGGTTSSGGGGGAGGCEVYASTIVVDGTNDFSVMDESFASTSASYTGYLAWDGAYVYVGMKGPDVASTAGTRWLLAYLGTPTAGATTTTGQPYAGGVLSPMLPFPASWHFRRKFGGDEYQSFMTYSGGWNDGTLPTGATVARTGDFVELRLPLSAFGNPTKLRLHLSMINEQTGGEYTFAGVPSTSFAEGIDPDYTKYFELELDGCDVPSMLAPL